MRMLWCFSQVPTWQLEWHQCANALPCYGSGMCSLQISTSLGCRSLECLPSSIYACCLVHVVHAYKQSKASNPNAEREAMKKANLQKITVSDIDIQHCSISHAPYGNSSTRSLVMLTAFIALLGNMYIISRAMPQESKQVC